ncbi:ribonuclease P protein component [Mesobacillus harenae]|uniref:ribonuclease P protein component n=1 Tax=Mesobacillus harenae TaxID=2213203 RepID=UPI00157FD4AF|nr:ribonuclease P protein component [Mesobacillus harenae]
MRKELRIKKNKDFQEAFKKGKSVANRQFVVYTLGKPEQEMFRIGLSVSKKIGNAVVRNRIKRYIRQSFLEIQDQVQVGNDYVIIARKPVADMDMHDVKKSLLHVLRVAKVLNKSVTGKNG